MNVMCLVRLHGQKIRCIANAGVVKHRQLMYRDYLPPLYLRASGTGSARRNETWNGSRNNPRYTTRRNPMVSKEIRLTELSHCAG